MVAQSSGGGLNGGYQEDGTVQKPKGIKKFFCCG